MKRINLRLATLFSCIGIILRIYLSSDKRTQY